MYKWQSDVEGEDRCPECRGAKFTTVYYLAKLKSTHEDLPPTPYRGARPCRLCNRGLKPKNTRIDHVRDITEEEYERLTE
jgi:hypothetical protein